MVEFKEATLEELLKFAPMVRQMDVDESLAASGHSIEEALRIGLEDSLWTMIMYYKGEPMNAFGIAPSNISPRIGIPWMVATERMYSLGKVLLSHSPKFVEKFHEDFPILTNMADIRNVKAIRWLKWLGFDFPYVHQGIGRGGETFVQFVRYK